MAKTSLRDIARDAGCGRATLYRVFPAGRPACSRPLGQRELARFVDVWWPPVSMRRTPLEDALVGAVNDPPGPVAATRPCSSSSAHEPGLVLPYLGFGQVDRLYRAATRAGSAPDLALFVGAEQADWAVEWVARVVVSYLSSSRRTHRPHRRGRRRRLVSTYLVPALATNLPAAHASATFSLSPSLTGADHVHDNEELIGRDDVNDLEAILADHQHRRRRGRSTR